MKTALILHGMGEGPESFWYPYVKRELEKKGYEVWVPALPDKDTPTLTTQLPFVLKNGKFSEETILIGHSAGVPLAISVLENLSVKIKQALCVAGFITPLKQGEGGANRILQDSYKWDVIKSHVSDITFIHSDNDPWGCDDKQGRILFDHLGGTLIIRAGEGHMGSNTYNQPYREFPFLVKLIS